MGKGVLRYGLSYIATMLAHTKKKNVRSPCSLRSFLVCGDQKEGEKRGKKKWVSAGSYRFFTARTREKKGERGGKILFGGLTVPVAVFLFILEGCEKNRER